MQDKRYIINTIFYNLIENTLNLVLKIAGRVKLSIIQRTIAKKGNRKTVINLICLALYNGLGGLLIIITQIKIANYIGPNEYGVYSYFLALGDVGAMFVRYGRDKSLLRDILSSSNIESKRNRIIDTFQVGCLNLLIFLITITIFRNLLELPLAIAPLLIIGGTCLISLDFQPVYESMQEMGWHAIYNFIQKLIYIISIWTLVLCNAPITMLYLGITITISWCIVLVAQFLEIKKTWDIDMFNKVYIRRLLGHYKTGIYLALCSFLAMAFGPLLRLILKLSATNEAVGVFSAGMQIYSISMFLLMQISRIGNPKMVKLAYESDYRKLISFIKRYFLIIIFAAFPFSILMISIPDIITNGIFSENYKSLTTILPWIGVILLLYSIVIVEMSFIIAFRKDKYYLFVEILGLIIIIVAGFTIISSYQIIGAAVALTISYAVMVVLLGIKMNRILCNLRNQSSYFQP